MRLQRMLARAGVASRRKAEELIKSGSVSVNGTTATLGQKVDPRKDVIEVDGTRVESSPTVWLALNKPVGTVVSRADEQQRATVFELVPAIAGLTYVGRLDILTSGLLLLTNDGELANMLTHPRYGAEKSYRVVATGGQLAVVRAALAAGVEVDGQAVRIKRFELRRHGRTRLELDLVLTEGRNKIVRRLCTELGLKVDGLARTGHGPIELGKLPEGKWRHLNAAEVAKLDVLRKQGKGKRGKVEE